MPRALRRGSSARSYAGGLIEGEARPDARNRVAAEREAGASGAGVAKLELGNQGTSVSDTPGQPPLSQQIKRSR
jgi:hypothetical protein